MQVEQAMAYELNGNRVAVWKSEYGDWIVTNTFTGKALLCISCEEALDVFDHCLEAIHGNQLLN